MKKRRFQKVMGKKKDKTLELDITSLLDILVILLVFLLKSYNASDLKLDLISKVELPNSQTRVLGHDAVIIQVNKDQNIWVDHKLIGKIQTSDEKLSFLYDELISVKQLKDEQASKMRLLASETKQINKNINIVMDKTLPYKTLRQIMHTSALAGFPHFKFIVQGDY